MAGLTERQIVNYIKKIAPKEMAQETFKNLKPQIEIFKNEIQKIKKEFELVGFLGKKSRLDFSNKKDKERMLIVAQRAYILIEKMREYFTKETIDYLILVEDDQIQITKGTLEQLVSTLSIIKATGGKLRLQITHFSKIKTWQDADISKPVLDSIKNIYNILMSFNRPDQYISTGYSFEVSVMEALKNDSSLQNKNPQELANYLLNQYKLHLRGEKAAFYREGDLPKEISQKLLKETKNITLQLKRISSQTSAPLAMINTLNVVLRNVDYILNSELAPEKMVELINKYLFNAEKNLTKTIEKKLKEEVNAALKILEK
jgi:hypothetical protein